MLSIRRRFVRGDSSGGCGRAVTVAVLAAFTVQLPVPAARAFDPHAGTIQYKFTNNENAKACDLHFELTAAVTWNINDAQFVWQIPNATFPITGGSGTTTVDLAAADCGAAGEGVAIGATVTLRFGYPGGTAPLVKKWWWTDGNGGRLGAVKWPLIKKTKFDYTANVGGVAAAGAAGDGVVSIGACGEAGATFNTTAGEDEATSAANMVAAIESAFALEVPVFVDPNDPHTVVFGGGCFGDTGQDPAVSVPQQDTNGTIDVATALADPLVPAVSEWGLVAMTLLVLAAGTVAVRRGRIVNSQT